MYLSDVSLMYLRCISRQTSDERRDKKGETGETRDKRSRSPIVLRYISDVSPTTTRKDEGREKPREDERIREKTREAERIREKTREDERR
jgi:hypothetical protein